MAAHYFNKRLKELDQDVLKANHSIGEMMRFVANVS